jgi:hypothetical protein
MKKNGTLPKEEESKGKKKFDEDAFCKQFEEQNKVEEEAPKWAGAEDSEEENKEEESKGEQPLEACEPAKK